ncbi:GlxA family transcriptional regulator [Glycomyces artemisiae]|uniref:AraC family transcriptional regulator with amidase-like domain n=1 Tax=Glycomyces artemisiae TaxID=1076443 RepID=A0A2T0ULA2_9ACTN|nr:helix-turn-helix domain-containing protein [Glycomyces artemisiae]PRY58705.1 AraC family transcriptional regulator with amidase-like domain [Glycomyces artemisiae]
MHRVAVIAVEGVAGFDLVVPSQVFGTAHSMDRPPGALLGAPLYEVMVCGDGPGLAVTAAGGTELFRIAPAHGLADIADADTVVLPGMPVSDAVPDVLLASVRAAYERGARLVAVCNGAFVLAQTGLLDGRRATCHWTDIDAFAQRFPQVEAVPDVLYVQDGRLVTTAGAATGLDVCLHLIRQDFGSAVADEVARHFVATPQRDAAQAQLVAHKEPRDDGESLEPTMQWLRRHLGDPVTLADIAKHAGVSARTLNRRFRDQTGTTPMQWRLRLRVHRAQTLLETTALPVEEIARHCGFGTSIALRQHFARLVGMPPLAYRRAFQVRQG